MHSVTLELCMLLGHILAAFMMVLLWSFPWDLLELLSTVDCPSACSCSREQQCKLLLEKLGTVCGNTRVYCLSAEIFRCSYHDQSHQENMLKVFVFPPKGSIKTFIRHIPQNVPVFTDDTTPSFVLLPEDQKKRLHVNIRYEGICCNLFSYVQFLWFFLLVFIFICIHLFNYFVYLLLQRMIFDHLILLYFKKRLIKKDLIFFQPVIVFTLIFLNYHQIWIIKVASWTCVVFFGTCFGCSCQQ